jgi:hypothetical protein
MNYVFGSCFTCGRITARRFLRTKELIGCMPKGKADKIWVCTICEKKLQSSKGIEDRNDDRILSGPTL